MTGADRLAASASASLLLALVCVLVAEASAGNDFNVATHAIHVSEPPDLAGDYEGAIGDFGVPLYGGSLTGQVLLPGEGLKGCERFGEAAIRPDWVDRDTPIIALIDRGDCYFVEKAFHAQQAGASAVIIADTSIEPLITMTTPQDNPEVQSLIKEIDIPTALVTKQFGDRLKGVLAAGAEVIMELNWEESMVNPGGKVEWEFWTTSNDACGPSCDDQAAFKQSAAEIAMQLDLQGFTSFTPHYKIRSCEKLSLYVKEDCEKKCIHNGRYCLTEHVASPYNETHGEREIMMENKRQLCIFDFLKRTDQPQLWWRYVSEYGTQCQTAKGTFGSECSRSVQSNLGVQDTLRFLSDVSECMRDSLADKSHPLLEMERDHEMEIFKQGHGRINFLPAIIINSEIQYRGRLDRTSVLRAICAGFKEATEPGICLQDSIQVNECSSGHGCWRNPDASLGDAHSATCLDTFRGHLCMCPHGYIGDGYTCEELNECSLGISDCEQRCVNLVGSYRCECEEGFTTLGSRCILEDECEVGNGGCQHKCSWSVSGPQCSCHQGFELGENGKDCVDIDECARGQHECEHLCINTDPMHSGGLSYVCGCDDGYTHDFFGDPLLRHCIENEKVLEAWGVDGKKGSSTAFTILEIVLIVTISVLVVVGLGLVYFRWFHKRRMDREIRSILEQYVPLDDKAEAEKKAENQITQHQVKT